MSGLHNLKAVRVVKAFERAGWYAERQTGSHVILTYCQYRFTKVDRLNKGLLRLS